MKKKIGLIGAGLMGFPMAKNWLSKGFHLSLLPHKNKKNADEIVRLGGVTASSLGALVSESDAIVLMLPTSREVEALTLSDDGIIKFLKPDQICIDMTTSDPESTKRISMEFQKRSLRFFDAPVTGGVKGADAGTLTLFMGGPAEWIVECEEIFKAISHVRSHFGEVGSGHVAKIINNFICIGNLAVFSEALPMAVKLGIEPKKIYETLMGGMGSSEMLKYYVPQILKRDFDPRFKLAHAYKDLRLAEGVAAKLGISFPVLNGMLDDFGQAEKSGLSDQNLSSLITVIEKKLGVQFRADP